jgi:hypothetical protein
MDLAACSEGVGHVFHHCEVKHSVETGIGDRQVERVANEIEMGIVVSAVDLREVNGSVVSMIEDVPVSGVARANVEHACSWRKGGANPSSRAAKERPLGITAIEIWEGHREKIALERFSWPD